MPKNDLINTSGRGGCPAAISNISSKPLYVTPIPEMDPRALDVRLCDLCKTDPIQRCCGICNINLCINCVQKHISDSSQNHNVGPYHFQKFSPKYLKCLKHTKDDCELYCAKCDISVCSTCALFGKHNDHDISDILEILSFKKQNLRNVLEELDTRIYPRYEEMASYVQREETELERNCEKLTTAVVQQGDALHREISNIVMQRKCQIAEIKAKHLDALQKQTDEITEIMTEMKQDIFKMKNILDTNDISLTLNYKSRNDEFNKLPPKIQVTLPILCTPTINTEKLNGMIGSLSSLSITTVRQLLDEPRLAETIYTGYKELHDVRCLSDDQIWTRGNSKTMKLFNIQGKLLTSLKTKSGNRPWGIAVTLNKDLVFTEPDNKTVNLVKNKEIRTVITQQGWTPRKVCSASDDDILVTMVSDDRKHSQVVRYSGFTEKQTIQFDDQGRPLYSSVSYITENRNLDICVVDYESSAVVVVNQLGKLRFRYTGHPPNTKESFYPVGIATDSQSHILAADCDNHRIHILDQVGQFLRYIENCDLRSPLGLCVDMRDNLFVAERYSAKVKKIQYL